ncbi:MAG: Crp/Fnr family transcriptional regulator, partial [Muribaculum sp.]|nr:Crp/Fnr family transcriptional regulator [Muribaculum sp.]
DIISNSSSRPMKPLEFLRKTLAIELEVEQRLASMIQERRYRRGDMIRGSITLSSNAFYIISGSARVFYTIGGKEHTFSFAFADQFITLSSYLISIHPDTVAIQFLEPTQVVFIPHLKVKDVLEEAGYKLNSTALLLITTAMEGHMRALEERMDVLQTLSVEERYQWAIKRYPRLPECATVTQIASFLGVTRETLYRIRSGRYSRPNT